MRLFVAINFDEETKDRLQQVQRLLKAKGRGNFSRRENLHLTLAFLGEVDEKKLPLVKEAMEDVSVEEMKLCFSKVGCFRGDSELWWIGIEENKALERLQKNLTRNLRARGFSLESRQFKPHITLARQMNIGHLDSQKTIKPFTTKVDSMQLMLSHRVDGKLTYTELYRTKGDRDA